jgi:hypothetical protein
MSGPCIMGVDQAVPSEIEINPDVTRAGLDRMNGQPDIADIDLGVFGPAVASWSRTIANAER